MRKYIFSDADLIIKGKEKISFMRRDYTAFALFGITEIRITELERALTAFSEKVTDIEAKNNQTEVTQTKNAKGEELKTAIRNVMQRIELVFGKNSAQYRQSGSKALSKKSDSEVLIAAKVLVQRSTIHLQELMNTGITTAMLDNIIVLCNDFEELIHEQNDKIWERNFLKENRIEQGNAIYATLIQYTAIGFEIWQNNNVARYNDYIIYDRASRN
ncbi:MAG: hypothetical protein V4572_05595 [Bacteroidota bacterium]